MYVGRICFLCMFICCCTLFCGAGLKQAEAEEARVPLSQLEATVNEIIDILRNGDIEEEWERKKEEIIPLIDERLNSKEIARRALGRHWRDLSDDRKEEFTSLFMELLKDTYLNRLKNSVGSSQARFTEQRKRGNRAIVYSIVVRSNQQEIPMDYRLIKSDDKWGIYDIVVEGISLISNYRKQFDQIMARGGYADLIARLREKTGN